MNEELANLSAETTLPQQSPAAVPDAEQLSPTLPENYLSGGYYATTDKGMKYLRPEFVDAHARSIAASLTGMKPSDFAAMLRDLKRAKKSTLPFEARQTAAAELLPRAIGLTHRKKAPAILVDFIKANLAAIKTDEDWSAFFRHMNAISGYLVLNTADK